MKKVLYIVDTGKEWVPWARKLKRFRNCDLSAVQNREQTAWLRQNQRRNIPHYDEPHELKLRVPDVLRIGKTRVPTFHSPFPNGNSRKQEVSTIGQSNQRVSPPFADGADGGKCFIWRYSLCLFMETAENSVYSTFLDSIKIFDSVKNKIKHGFPIPLSLYPGCR